MAEVVSSHFAKRIFKRAVNKQKGRKPHPPSGEQIRSQGDTSARRLGPRERLGAMKWQGPSLVRGGRDRQQPICTPGEAHTRAPRGRGIFTAALPEVLESGKLPTCQQQRADKQSLYPTWRSTDRMEDSAATTALIVLCGPHALHVGCGIQAGPRGPPRLAGGAVHVDHVLLPDWCGGSTRGHGSPCPAPVHLPCVWRTAGKVKNTRTSAPPSHASSGANFSRVC